MICFTNANFTRMHIDSITHPNYWGVFDGAVNHYYEKFGGFLIPNDYCKMFITSAEKDPNDDYKIIKTMPDGEQFSKLIYGFNTKEDFEKIVEHEDEFFKESIQRIEQLLQPNKYGYIITEEEYHVRVIYTFFDNFLLGRQTFTPYMVSMINKSKDFLIRYINGNKNIQNEDYYSLAVENAKDILKYATRMRLFHRTTKKI